MRALFQPRHNALLLIVLAGGLALPPALAAAAWLYFHSPYQTGVGYTPEQPVPFSHKHHVGGLGIDCRYCHNSVERSDFAGMPPTHTCMSCHSQEWTNAAMLAPVRDSLRLDQPLRWLRVHNLADYAYFSHRAHVNNGVGCESCHGRVDRMPLIAQRAPLTMEWCLACHRNPAPHLRPRAEITTMGYRPDADATPGAALMRHFDIPLGRLTECYTCHR